MPYKTREPQTRLSSLSGYTGRIRLMALVFALIACLCVGRLYYLQILKGTYYAQAADRQFVEPSDPLFDRGTIYFTDKNGSEIEIGRAHV